MSTPFDSSPKYCSSPMIPLASGPLQTPLTVTDNDATDGQSLETTIEGILGFQLPLQGTCRVDSAGCNDRIRSVTVNQHGLITVDDGDGLYGQHVRLGVDSTGCYDSYIEQLDEGGIPRFVQHTEGRIASANLATLLEMLRAAAGAE